MTGPSGSNAQNQHAQTHGMSAIAVKIQEKNHKEGGIESSPQEATQKAAANGIPEPCTTIYSQLCCYPKS
jgi:hypothetical protein